MVQASVNQSSTVFKYTTDVTTAQTNVCRQNVSTIQTGNTVVLTGVDIGGDLEFVNTSTATTACVLGNTMDTNILAIMKAVAAQTSKVDQSIFTMGFSFSANARQVYQSINNSITNIQQSICQMNDDTIQSNNMFILSTATVGGDLVIGNQSNVSSTCTAYNIGKIAVKASQTDTTGQQGEATNVFSDAVNGFFGSFFSIMVIIIILVVIGVIALIAFGGFEVLKPSDSTAPASAGEGNSEADLLNNLLG